MTQKKKNNIIIGSLCAIVLLMVVGYAAFSSVLNIKGTSSIASNWNILITNVKSKNIVGSASNAEEPSWEALTASFKTNLVSPGDSIEYDITVENRGNLNATLDKITLTDSNNPAIKFTSSGLEEGSELNAGDTAVLTVKVEYDNNVTQQPDSKEGTFNVTLDYSQKEGSGGNPGEITGYTGTVYSYHVLTGTENWTSDDWAANGIYIGNDIERIKGYTEDYSTLGNNFFLKHILTNGKVDSSEVCFMKDTQMHCFKPNEFETSKAKLFSLFEEKYCESDATSAMCNDGSIQVILGASGSAYIRVATIMCGVFGDNSSACYVAEQL